MRSHLWWGAARGEEPPVVPCMVLRAPQLKKKKYLILAASKSEKASRKTKTAHNITMGY